jgi:hypothetical protein
VWSLNVEPLNFERRKALNDRNYWNDWNEPQHTLAIGTAGTIGTFGTNGLLAVLRSARVRICLMLFVNCCTLSLELLNYHPVRGKKRLPQMPQK